MGLIASLAGHLHSATNIYGVCTRARVCVCFPKTANSLTATWCPITQSNSVINYLALLQTLQVKSLIPQGFPFFRC